MEAYRRGREECERRRSIERLAIGGGTAVASGYGFDDTARTDSRVILPELSTISSWNWIRSAEDR